MSKRPLVPEAKEKLNKIKTEFANELGSDINDSSKGSNLSKINGKIGGPIGGMMTRNAVEQFEKKLIDK
ncbi:alpha/beta-type small acid-soluble spore protein [Clostridium sp. 19966]|uniref:alpha/beta-type small acid-soluble spore protein n=1 Tax=Clostridium sp. 19966 TaxID=2768166 RepID=UPI0028DEC490|nr:alpha/beta-type small acid-soluble spore protein [Clostridium sp. 19966]MDT8715127.1 alpha/beta-type small acid-soluble spore protein [Clostridium sp. 19966]